MTRKRTATDIVDAVADAAHALFLERSPSAVSVREIASAADVNLGLIHRYVGSKNDVIALVLARHTSRAASVAADLDDTELTGKIADAVVHRPETGRLIAGMILDGVDVTELKGDFPLLERMAGHTHPLNAAMTYALALGWEVFGPSLLAAIDADPAPGELAAVLSNAMGSIENCAAHRD